MPDKVSHFSRHDKVRVGRAVKYVETLSREATNVTPLPGFAPATTGETVMWVVKVGEQGSGSAELSAMYHGTVYLPKPVPPGTGNWWQSQDCWIIPLDGTTLDPDTYGMGRLIGFRPRDAGFPDAGSYDARPVYVVAPGAGSETEAGTCPGGCGTLVGLADDACLSLEVVCATGSFSAMSTTQVTDAAAQFRPDGAGAWRLQEWVDGSPGSWQDFNFNWTGGTGTAVLTFEADGKPVLSLGGDPLYTRCVGADATFVGGPRNGFTGGGSAPADPCDPNDFVLRVACTCCSIDGWEGPDVTGVTKWYCVDTGGGCPGEALPLTDADRCDDTIVICSGPYDTQAEAEADCPGSGSGGTVTCEDCGRALNSTLTATISGGNGTISLGWNSTDMQWKGSATLPCGDQLHLAFSLDCVLFYSCTGVNYQPGVNLLPAIDCGPPFTIGTFAIDLDNAGADCTPGNCGSLTVSLSE